MTLETFFEKFDQFADAPDAVAKMRELVVQWSIRGKLLPQRQSEETKSLLELAKKAKVKAQGSKSKAWLSNDALVPFGIPSNWTCLCVGDAIEMINGRAFKSTEWAESGVPIVRIQNLNNPHASFNYFKGDFDERHRIENGTFLISWSGTPGTSFGAFIWERGEALLNQHIFNCVRFGKEITADYLKLAINARLDEMISHAQGGVGLRHITKGKLESIAIPLPPLAEQKRIMAKVDELMALCDRLEAQQHERDTRHAALARASLARFAEAPTPANLHHLFHPSYTIPPADLRKSILTLAVQGKLVPQDPNDNSAKDDFPTWSELETAKRNNETPSHWISLPLGQVGNWTGGGTPSKSKPEFWNGRIPWVCPKDMKRPLIDSSIDMITKEGVDGSSAKVIQAGSLLMVVRGMILVRDFPSAIAVCEVTINQDMKSVYPAYPDTNEYLHLALCALKAEFLNAVERSSHGTCKLLTKDLQAMPIPVPPLAEQRRIVSKVDQLMALVDELETQLAASHATAKNLLQALVTELTSN